MNMGWNFASRSGDFTISKFDKGHFDNGLTFSGDLCAPGQGCGTPQGNHFGGAITGQLPNDLGSLSGWANGSFVRGPDNFNSQGQIISGSTPQGVIGNWHVGSERYNAAGVFGGAVNSR
jgi:hypothetical protein